METAPAMTQPAMPLPTPVDPAASFSVNLHVFHVSGIVTQPGAPIAVINNRILRVGDVIDDATVREITPTSVVLERHNVWLTLYLAH